MYIAVRSKATHSRPEYDGDDTTCISSQQWVHTDSATLVLQQFDFLVNLAEEINNMTVHHFISKAQSAFLSDSKATVYGNVAKIMLDFAENYS